MSASSPAGNRPSEFEPDDLQSSGPASSAISPKRRICESRHRRSGQISPWNIELAQQVVQATRVHEAGVALTLLV